MASPGVLDAPMAEPVVARRARSSWWFLGRRPVDAPLALYLAAILVSPWYVFDSGLPQPGDVLMLLAAIVQAVTQGGRLRFPRYARGYVFAMVGFVAWVVLVGSTWTMILGYVSPARNAVFYVFNGLVALVTMSLPARYGRGVVPVIMGAYVVSMVGSLSGGLLTVEIGLYRQTLTFNNPNQVGYFALLAASIATLPPPSGKGRPWWADATSLTVAATMVVFSASRAAMVAMLPLLLAVSLRSRRGWMYLVGGAAVGPALLFTVGTTGSIAAERLSDLENNAERGYDRIYKHVEYVFLGAGEGGFARYDRVNYLAEIHSTPGTILFSYGLPGTVLFLLILWQPVRLAGPLAALSIAPAMVYGLTHQGLRTTELWVLTAMLVATAGEARAPRPAPGITARPSAASPDGLRTVVGPRSARERIG